MCIRMKQSIKVLLVLILSLFWEKLGLMKKFKGVLQSFQKDGRNNEIVRCIMIANMLCCGALVKEHRNFTRFIQFN